MKSRKKNKDTEPLFVAFRPTPDVNRRLRSVARAKGVSVSAVIMWALANQLPKFECDKT